jgi:hypothetical protein
MIREGEVRTINGDEDGASQDGDREEKPAQEREELEECDRINTCLRPVIK